MLRCGKRQHLREQNLLDTYLSVGKRGAVAFEENPDMCPVLIYHHHSTDRRSHDETVAHLYGGRRILFRRNIIHRLHERFNDRRTALNLNGLGKIVSRRITLRHESLIKRIPVGSYA